MLERIIFAPSANEAELLRTLASFGVNTLGLRIMSGAGLAEYALMRSGITVKEKYADSNAQTALIYSLLGNIPLFADSSFADAKNITAALETVRTLIPEEEETALHEKLGRGEFPENSLALGEVYDRYTTALKSEGLIDRIMLIRRAIADAGKIAAEVTVLEEFPLTPLERRLAEKVTGSNYRTMKLTELFGAEEKALSQADITAAYGEINEAENIISQIYENDLPLDSCTVVVANMARYPQLFFELAGRYDIPMTFGCGLPISNAYPAQFLRNYSDWKTTGYCGVDALKKMIFSSSFDRDVLLEALGIENNSVLRDLVVTAGNLRLCDDKAINKERIDNYKKAYPECPDTTSLLRKLAAEFEAGCVSFISRYALIRKSEYGRIDKAALNEIVREIEAYTRFAGGSAVSIIPDILSRNVLSENRREGCLHICKLSQAMCCMRENLFIAGLSADSFPGSPAENYLVPDNDMLLFDSDAPISEKTVSDRKEHFFALLRFAASLGVAVHLSYSGYNAAELKDKNVSSVLFEVYSRCNGGDADIDSFTASIKQTGYFDSDISPARYVGRAYNSGEITIEPVVRESDKPVSEADIVLSPSAVETFRKCPKHFYYKHLLRVKAEEKDDVFTVIDAAKQGELIHQLMKYSAEEKPDMTTFQKQSEKAFDRYIAARPPVNEPEIRKYRDDFLRMALVGYHFMNRNETIAAEKEVGPVEIAGLTLKGRLDCLARNADGEYIIGDYKTGRKITQKENDTASCLQVLLYAYMLRESEGINVTGGEYRYLRYDKAVKCTFSNVVAEEIDNILETLKSAIDTGEYPTNDKNCQYCDYADICRKEETKNE